MAPRTSGRSLFLGTLVHSKTLDRLEYLQGTAVCVDENGIIVAIQEGCDQSAAEQSLYPKLGWSRDDVTVRRANEGEFFFPGFIGQFNTLSSSFLL
jgi:guanine deaminase